MYRFKIYNRIKLVCFLKFVVCEINSKMVKSAMVMLIEREKSNVVVSWMLQPATETMVSERKRKN
jgi:hypothetical protein